jgi:hypothetical protein
MNVDFQGQWVSIKGFANVILEKNSLSATLLLDADTSVYHEIEATLDPEDWLIASVKSPDKGVEDFQLQGQLFRGDTINGTENVMALLTDGTTVLGLTFGPQSHLTTL